jgi:hypothetical protein
MSDTTLDRRSYLRYGAIVTEAAAASTALGGAWARPASAASGSFHCDGFGSTVTGAVTSPTGSTGVSTWTGFCTGIGGGISTAAA